MLGLRPFFQSSSPPSCHNRSQQRYLLCGLLLAAYIGRGPHYPPRRHHLYLVARLHHSFSKTSSVTNRIGPPTITTTLQANHACPATSRMGSGPSASSSPHRSPVQHRTISRSGQPLPLHPSASYVLEEIEDQLGVVSIKDDLDEDAMVVVSVEAVSAVADGRYHLLLAERIVADIECNPKLHFGVMLQRWKVNGMEVE